MSDPVHPIRALQEALKRHLLAQPALVSILGQAVHETPARGTKPPFIAFGDAILRDAGSTAREAVTIEFDLVVQAAERSTHSALDILSEVETALRLPMPEPAGHHLVWSDTRQRRGRHDATRNQTRASLTLRAFLEPL
jgi:hypothetical protein